MLCRCSVRIRRNRSLDRVSRDFPRQSFRGRGMSVVRFRTEEPAPTGGPTRDFDSRSSGVNADHSGPRSKKFPFRTRPQSSHMSSPRT